MNVMISATHQDEPVVCIYMSPPSGASLPPPTPPHISRLSQSTGFGFPVSYTKFPLAPYFINTYGKVCATVLLSQLFLPRPPLLCPKVCPLYLCLLCCPANRIISTIFLDSIYMC